MPQDIEIIPSNLSDQNAMGLDINYRERTAKNTKTRIISNTFLNNKEVTEDIRREIKRVIERNDKNNDTKPMGCSKTVLRGKCITIQSYLEIQENYKIDNLTLHLNQLIKEQQQQQQKAKNSKWK